VAYSILGILSLFEIDDDEGEEEIVSKRQATFCMPPNQGKKAILENQNFLRFL
jgi:hypothetical protein